MYKQYIILRKDVNASPQKLAVMTAHASMAFLTSSFREVMRPCTGFNPETNEFDIVTGYRADIYMEKGLVENWINDVFTKVLLEAKNLNHIEKAVIMAQELGLEEGKDYFCIRDKCLTELIPDEGKDTCFIAIGFRPMDEETIKPLTKKYQLYK